jgi:hypothetical protein
MDRETYIAKYIAVHFSHESNARQLEIMSGLWLFFDALTFNQKPPTRFDSEALSMVESESPISAQSHLKP